ncbi:hypothetical protein [Streptomyces sp. PTD5-9]|uniref:hypothetical protein n=1 Tax=Streptomyces sp. PTD5-9 TaxID=3120150 RepID=UPI003FCD49E8
MSTERPDNDVTAPTGDVPQGASAAAGRPRRRAALAASVAAAVLLAGGGGAYWAATAADGDGGTAAAKSPTPPPLALDPDADGPGPSPDGPPRGIAIGEPDPHGGRVVHRASGELPQGPGRAPVRRAAGTVTAAEVTRLAKALGLAGVPRAEGGSWTVGSDKDGSGPFLRVDRRAPGAWTFDRYGSGGTDDCRGVSSCAGGKAAPGGGPAQDGGGSPVDESAAKAAAAPVLKATGQGGAALDAGQLMGSARVVNADPVVDGLPTYGWSTGIRVGPDGEVVGGSGHLKGLEKTDDYPVISAGEALKQLNGSSSRAGGGAGIGGCADPVPLKDGVRSPGVRCGARTGAEPPVTTVTVDKAVFGLSLRRVGGEQALVPSWLFSVRPTAGGTGTTVARVAVDPAYLAKDASATPPGDEGGTSGGDAPGTSPARQILSYAAEGRTLSVTFWGGVCSGYAASAVEDGKSVTVTVTESGRDAKKVCVMTAEELTRTVTLDAPLGDRTVIDAASGARVPRG